MGNANANATQATFAVPSQNNLTKPPFQYTSSNTGTPRVVPPLKPLSPRVASLQDNRSRLWGVTTATEVCQVPVTPRTMQYIQTLSIEDQQRYLAGLAGGRSNQPNSSSPASTYLHHHGGDVGAGGFYGTSSSNGGVATTNTTSNYNYYHQQQQPSNLTIQRVGPGVVEDTTNNHWTYNSANNASQPFNAQYSILLPGSEHLIATQPALGGGFGAFTQQQQHLAPVYRTSFSGTDEGEYLCISPVPLSNAEVINMTMDEVIAYGARVPTVSKQLSFTNAQMMMTRA